ncbi:MAG TPA: DoxX family protein [Gemmatimonadaceae bacterium]|nr:DoxX family protein [Gemmatimonadaceae bacterium]
MTARISPASATPLSVALLVLRLATGAVFIAHGYQKLFQRGIAGVTHSFGGMGVPLPEVVAPVVSVLEFAGGIALILGVLTRIVAVGLAVDMLGAMLIAHLPHGFFLPRGIEFTMMLFAASVALALAGAGAYSIDASLAARRARLD